MMIYYIIALVNHVKELWVVKLDMSFLIVNILCNMIMLLDCERRLVHASSFLHLGYVSQLVI